MYKFLETEIFKLKYPSFWSYESDDQVHSIFDTQGIGAFQISEFRSNSSQIKFNLNEEKLAYENSIIKEYPNFKAIYFMDSAFHPESLIFKWITGKDRNMIFCTYTISKDDFETKSFRNELKFIEGIVKSLKVK